RLAEALAEVMWRFVSEHRVHIRVLIRNVLDTGAHTDVVMSRFVFDLMDRLDQIVMALRPDWTKVRGRLFVLSLMHTLARFAVGGRARLSAMAGEPDDLDAAVRAFLRDTVRDNLRLP